MHRLVGSVARYSVWCCGVFLPAVLLAPSAARAQDNYEIQVYASETVPAGRTMVELHSNYAVNGERETVNGVLPSNHALHETLEITQGFTPWFETGFYLFNSVQPQGGWQWVGSHVRPRIRVPEEWHWPLGLSLSTEVGYQRRSFSEDTWTWELRPILDKQFGPVYVALNPALEKSFHGLSSNMGFTFAPSAKVSVEATKVVSPGLEYYGSLGPLGSFSSWGEQQHQIFPVVDLNLSPKWELNFGVGFGLTHSTDGLLVKLIVGRQF
ncbi:MAG: hypothetical protein ABSH34_04440 [Verrucomicrobiota bacterium]